MEILAHSDKRDHHTTHKILVNGALISIVDPHPTGSEILAEAGFEPVDEHVLIEREKIGSRLISLDQRIEIHGGEVARFYAFRTGEVFTFTVNDHGFQWGKGIIMETEIREIARVAEEDILVLDRGNDEPQIFQASDKVQLCSTGTEHLRTERRLVKVFIDNVEKEIPRGFYTTEELISILKVQAGYLLNLATNDGLELLKPGQRIHVEDGMRFFSQVPGGGAS